MRTALLPISIQRGIGHITPKQLKTATHILDQMEAEPDQTCWLEYNRDFHRQLHGSQPNQHLQTTLERMADIATIYINLSFMKDNMLNDVQNTPQTLPQREQSEQEHRAILAAYRHQDQVLVTKLSLAHINSTLDAARNVLKAQ